MLNVSVKFECYQTKDEEAGCCVQLSFVFKDSNNTVCFET